MAGLSTDVDGSARSDQLSVEFHCRALAEMPRVAKEVRIFPLFTHGCQPSPHVAPVCDHLRDAGRTCEIQAVDYEFQRGANRMLRVT